MGPRQSRTSGSALPRAQSRRYSGPTPPSAPSLSRARPSAKIGLDRGRFSAEGPALGEEAFAECPRSGPRQNEKPSAVLLFPVVVNKLMRRETEN